MKFLIFCPYYPPHTGGLETHAAEFNKHLAADAAVSSITVITPHIPSNTPTKEVNGKVTIYRLPAFEIISGYPVFKSLSPAYRRSMREISQTHYDIVISRTRFFLTSLSAGMYAKTKKSKWVHIEHGSDYVQLSSPVKTAVARLYDVFFGRLIFRKSDLNIAISKAVHRFIQRFDKRNTPIICRGLELQDMDTIKASETIKRDYAGKVIITFVGRLYKWKGVAHSIQAVRGLSDEQKKKIVFLVVGDGEDKSHLDSLAEAPVVMLGNKTRDEAISILKASDIYIHSALPGGGLSTSLMEAMYCGCAVIATPNEGADEVVDASNGILIPEPSETAIRQALEPLLNDFEKRQRLGQAAHQTIAKRFSWPSSIAAYKQVFHSLLD